MAIPFVKQGLSAPLCYQAPAKTGDVIASESTSVWLLWQERYGVRNMLQRKRKHRPKPSWR
jgi:hypothetical protein